jgi:uncharacterized protein (TIGR02145 family)
MKKMLLLALTVLTLNSCSKSSNEEPSKEETSTNVTINGTAYPTVKIGNKTWTTVNYNGSGGLNYNNSSNNAAYGKLYLLIEAKAIVLPVGWRLPTKQDFIDLLSVAGQIQTERGDTFINAAGSTKLRSKGDWNFSAGVNTTGFNAYPTGSGDFDTRVDSNRATFTSKGEETIFWSFDQYATGSQYALKIVNYKDAGGSIGDFASTTREPQTNKYYSIRFVKDN